MSYTFPELSSEAHGRTTRAGEPFVFHCNFYNYWLQRVLLLDPDLGMEQVLHDAAAAVAYAYLAPARRAEVQPAVLTKIAERSFGQHGFGTMDLSHLGPDGGVVNVPVSHYGQCLRQAIDTDFEVPQTYFDAGFAAGVAAALANANPNEFTGEIEACQSMGADAGRIRVHRGPARSFPAAHGVGPHGMGSIPAPFAGASTDEAGILGALSQLDLSGNEEGLIPRFGVMLTNHFGNFYNLASFEFLRKMDGTGLVEAGEDLLKDAGYRCAFHTFGGIMTSAEWDAVVRPQIKTKEDWVHGMVACVNALGWGVWRVVELSRDRVVVRIFDDYESTGWLAHYGRGERPVSHLACAGVAGMMNLIYLADLEAKPALDLDFYADVFERDGAFVPQETQSLAMGAEFTEIVAERE